MEQKQFTNLNLKVSERKLRVANDNLSLAKFISELILNAFPSILISLCKHSQVNSGKQRCEFISIDIFQFYNRKDGVDAI